MRKFEAKDGKFLADGKEYRICSGAIHYFRVLPEYWEDRLKKLRACGLNTVETYMCWNLHEPREGEFDFSGRLDVRRFVKTAGELGLNVILRPGPYICAEWDFGGLPAWLLADENVRVRCLDPVYFGHVGRYISRVMEEVGDLQCTEGGPVIAMQVENEYGSYGNDKKYLAALRELMSDSGVKVMMFTSDGGCAYMQGGGCTEGALPTVNFGSNAAGNLKVLQGRDIPLMCTEFWCGWFDRFGGRHHTRSARSVVRELDSLFDAGASFNLYMFHGGTNFGFTAGANHHAKYRPTVTSYDYGAPLNEYGGYTPLYHAIRDLMCKKQGIKPDVLPDAPVLQNIGEVRLTECAGLFENAERIGVRHFSPMPLCMEKYGQNFGLIHYETVLPANYGTGILSLRGVHDRAYLTLNGAHRKTFDRSSEGLLHRRHSCLVSGLNKGDTVGVLVDAMGRVNYGEHLCDRKGISAVMFNNQFLMDFTVTSFPLDNIDKIDWALDAAGYPKFFRGFFRPSSKGECFVRFDGFTKGYIWVNGFNLGRFWNKGPQKALYLPGAILDPERENEIVLLELEHAGTDSVQITDKPDLG